MTSTTVRQAPAYPCPEPDPRSTAVTPELQAACIVVRLRNLKGRAKLQATLLPGQSPCASRRRSVIRSVNRGRRNRRLDVNVHLLADVNRGVLVLNAVDDLQYAGIDSLGAVSGKRLLGKHV